MKKLDDTRKMTKAEQHKLWNLLSNDGCGRKRPAHVKRSKRVEESPHYQAGIRAAQEAANEREALCPCGCGRKNKDVV